MTVSTNLGPWVNRRGIFDRHTRNDVFRDAKLASRAALGHVAARASTSNWASPSRTCSCCWAAAGLAHALTGARLLPVGTVYDPFVNRGLDALIYACYQDARFLLVSTPSGLTLAPEGGQHQSVNTPLIGMAADRLASFEPAHVDELGILLRHAFAHMQAPGRVRGVAAAVHPATGAAGPRAWTPPRSSPAAHWVVPPAPGARIALAYQGPVAPEATAAFAELRAEEAGRRAARDHQPRPAARRLAGGAARRGGRGIAGRLRRSNGCWPRSRPGRRW